MPSGYYARPRARTGKPRVTHVLRDVITEQARGLSAELGYAPKALASQGA